MPCRSDYMEPNAREKESKRVNQLLVYVLKELIVGGLKTAVLERGIRGFLDYEELLARAELIAKSEYGNENTLDVDTAFLCDLCNSMNDEYKNKIIYDGRNKDARQLADWFENHQEVDKKRIVDEQKKNRLEQIRKDTLFKLTDEEKEALGLKSE